MIIISNSSSARPSGMTLLLYLCILSLAVPGSADSSGFSRKAKSMFNLDLTAQKKTNKANHSLTRSFANHRFVVGGFAASSSRKKLQTKTGTARKVFFGDNVDEGGMGPDTSNPNRRGKVPVTDPYSIYKRRNYQATSPVAMKRTQNNRMGSKEMNENSIEESRERGRLVMSSSISADDIMGGGISKKRGFILNTARTIRTRIQQKVGNIDVGYAGIVATYVCTQIAITLPVILIPMIAADPYAPDSLMSSKSVNSAMFVGQIVSISSLGAGVGKVINGFVCKAIGGRISGSLYLLGLAFFSLVLSTTSSFHGYAIAGMEFCASVMWTASSVLMANKFENDASRFTAAITALSLGSTSGTLISKTFGGVLLSLFHWRQVCLLATFAALTGSAILFFLVREEQPEDKNENKKVVFMPKSGRAGTIIQSDGEQSKGGLEGMISSISNVVANPMFWLLGFAHFCLFIVRSSDKILGTFIFDATNLPRNLCGPLTTSVTLGFIGGLVSGKKIEHLESVKEKQQFVAKRFAFAILSALGLAFCANNNIIGLAGNYGIFGQYGLAASITILSGILAAAVGFQFYQFPPKFSTNFGANKAVYISLTDAFGFLLLSPFWSSISSIVASNDNGWTISWFVVASFLSVGGAITVNWLPTILRLDEEKRPQ